MTGQRAKGRHPNLTPWRGAVLGVVVIALAVSGYVAVGRHSGGSDPAAVVVSSTQCAPGWSAPPSGLTVFTVKNTSRDTIYGVDLVGANQVLVYGDIEMLAPGTEDQMEALLPPGDYLFECESFAGATLTSRVGRVSGPLLPERTPTSRRRQTRSSWRR